MLSAPPETARTTDGEGRERREQRFELGVSAIGSATAHWGSCRARELRQTQGQPTRWRSDFGAIFDVLRAHWGTAS